MQEDTTTPQADTPARKPLTITQAAAALHTSADAVRKRLRRGSLDGSKAADGTWLVFLPEQPKGKPKDVPRAEKSNRPVHHKQELLAKIATLEKLLDQLTSERDTMRASLATALRLVDQQQQLSLQQHLSLPAAHEVAALQDNEKITATTDPQQPARRNWWQWRR